MVTVTVQDVIHRLAKSFAAREGLTQPDQTVDGLLTGTSDTVVRGIAVTFCASYGVVQRALELDANLLITHEGIYYSHQTQASTELTGDPVYEAKQNLIHSSKLAIYRFHDAPHRYSPDIITHSLVAALGWEAHVITASATSTIVLLPEAVPAVEIAVLIKEKLHLPYFRYVGDHEFLCRRIGITVGYRGSGAHAIPLFREEGVELLIIGEGPEWETPEYVGDSIAQGIGKVLFLLGHAASEEPGMAAIAAGLQAGFPDVPVHYISSRYSIRVV